MTPKSEPIIAKLVRGETYILITADRNIHWSRSGADGLRSSHVVTPEQKAWLQEHAVDLVSYPGEVDGEFENEAFQKFSFSDEPEEDAAERTRRRQRARSTREGDDAR